MSLKKSLAKQKAKAADSLNQKTDGVFGLPVFGTPEGQEILLNVIDRISKSPFGSEILKDAAKAGYGVSLAFLGSSKGCCNPDKNCLFLSDNLSEDDMVATLVHEARHAGQFHRGCHKSFYDIDAQSTLTETRLTEADATACALAVCAELSEKGDVRPFGELCRAYPNESRTFAETYIKKGNEGLPEAMTAAVDAWYGNEALKMAYERCYLVEPLAEGFNTAAKRPAPKSVPVEEILAKVCTFKGGTYFSMPLSVFASEKYAAVSSPTYGWLQKYSEGWEAFYNEKCRDKSLESMKEFYVTPMLEKIVESNFGKMPVPVSERPEVLKIRMKRDKAFEKYFNKSSQKKDNAALLISEMRERGR